MERWNKIHRKQRDMHIVCRTQWLFMHHTVLSPVVAKVLLQFAQHSHFWFSLRHTWDPNTWRVVGMGVGGREGGSWTSYSRPYRPFLGVELFWAYLASLSCRRSAAKQTEPGSILFRLTFLLKSCISRTPFCDFAPGFQIQWINDHL